MLYLKNVMPDMYGDYKLMIDGTSISANIQFLPGKNEPISVIIIITCKLSTRACST